MIDRAAAAQRPVLLEVEGARLYGEWRREPPPGRPVLVFLHDGLGSAAAWRRFPDSLAGALGLGAFLYDRWGYGRSDSREAFPPDFMLDGAKRLPKILDAAGIEDCILVGHSDGATIALLHAAERPPRVRAAVSIAAHVHRDANAEARLHEFSRSLDDGEVPDWLIRIHGARAPHVLRCWIETWVATFAGDWTITDALRRIEVPLLGIQGSEDKFNVPAQIDTIAAEVSHAETHLLPGFGHAPHLEDTAAVVRQIADFLSRQAALTR